MTVEFFFLNNNKTLKVLWNSDNTLELFPMQLSVEALIISNLITY